MIASFDFCSHDEGIFFTPEVKLYLPRQEVIVDTQRWSEGMILTQRRMFLTPMASAFSLHCHSLSDMMLSTRKEDFYGFP